MDFKTGLVSIVTPTYNSEKYIEETVVSVLAQTYPNWELIIVDDCSKDNTRNLLEKIKGQDSRVRILFMDVNSGAGVSRNIGIEQARGQYLAFLDSDDIWNADKLEKQVNYLTETDSAICHTSFSFIDESGSERRGRVNVANSVDLIHNLKKTEIGTSTAIINRYKVKDKIIFPELRARQDLKLWITLLSRGYKSSGLNLPLVKYRVRTGSVSSNKWKMLYVTFKVYMSIKQLSYTKRFYCYFSYVMNAIKKRSD